MEIVIAVIVGVAAIAAIVAFKRASARPVEGLSAQRGETRSQKLEDGRTATVSVKEDGSSASFDIE